jgi:hypothetical protein
MQNVTNGQTLFIGDDSGVLVRPEIREGRQVWVQASAGGYYATDDAVKGLVKIREFECFTVDGKPYWMSGYDEEEGYPVITVAPRTLVG